MSQVHDEEIIPVIHPSVVTMMCLSAVNLLFRIRFYIFVNIKEKRVLSMMKVSQYMGRKTAFS